VSDAIDLKILGAGVNWLNVSHVITLHLNGYLSPLPQGSTVSIVTMDPGVASMESPRLLAEGRYDIGLTTPGWYGALAFEGRPPFEKPQSIRGLALLPHDDRMVIIARGETGITSLRQLVSERRAVRYSIPVSPTHPAIFAADEMLAAYGASRADLDAWGGRRLYDRPRFQLRAESKPADDDWEIIFDEAVMSPRYQNITRLYDVRFLPIDDDVLQRLDARGLPRAVVEKERFAQLTADVPTVDFSGWLLHCRESLPDEVAYLIARIIDQQRDEFPPRVGIGLTHPIDPMRFLPKMPIPLHPGAERYYREQGYL
jgi:TRAP-type uncharacterized transport system substrate-binding protein